MSIKGILQVTIPKQILLLPIVLCTLFAILLSTAHAEDIPWDEGKYTHYSNQEPLSSLLEALAASQKTPIIVSDKIDSKVSAYYKSKNPKDIFLDITKSNGLVWYYDGKTLYINKEEEMQTGSVSLTNTSATEFTKSLESIGILDHHYQWTSSDKDGMVFFKGPEQFVSAVLEMAKVLDKKPTHTSVYKWVDSKGVTNFSSTIPSQYEGNTDVKIIDKVKGAIVLAEPKI